MPENGNFSNMALPKLVLTGLNWRLAGLKRFKFAFIVGRLGNRVVSRRRRYPTASKKGNSLKNLGNVMNLAFLAFNLVCYSRNFKL